MRLGIVAGMVWNGRQHPDLDGKKLLIVQRVNDKLEPIEEYGVCIDSVGAGEGEWVITVGGSSARLTETTEHAPADETIIGIVDRVDLMARAQ